MAENITFSDDKTETSKIRYYKPDYSGSVDPLQEIEIVQSKENDKVICYHIYFNGKQSRKGDVRLDQKHINALFKLLETQKEKWNLDA